MPRGLLLALLLAAAPSASGQDAHAPTPGQRTVVALVTLAGGIAVPATLWGGSTNPWGSDAGRAVLVAPAPLGMAAGTITGARLLGLRPLAFEEALGDAVLGYVVGGGVAVVAGSAVGGGLYYAFGQQDYDFISPLIGGVVGLGVGLPLMLNLSTRSVEAGPAAFRAPTGEPGVGLMLRVGL